MPPRAATIRPGLVCWACRQSLRTPRFVPRRPIASTARRPAKSKEIDDFYALLLSEPLPTSARTTRKGPNPPKSSEKQAAQTPPPPPPPTDVEARARVVFGSRLAGPVERKKRAAERDAAATVIAGIRVPPRPSEPDNCCMSGCVNCVWDLYREELEEWAARRHEAETRLHGARQGGATDGVLESQQRVTGGAMGQAALSMDDDGGGSETNWDAEDALLPSSGSSLFASVPVGIREFMRTEKRIGQRKKEREASISASNIL